jgi:hypothetical protein
VNIETATFTSLRSNCSGKSAIGGYRLGAGALLGERVRHQLTGGRRLGLRLPSLVLGFFRASRR